MDSPISRFLNWPNTEETLFLKMGSHVHAVTMPKRSWDYLDSLLLYGFDVEKLLHDCAKKLLHDDPSTILQNALYRISRNEHEEYGIELQRKHRSRL